ncbi:MAG: hypothetical protein Q7K43_04465, partial [Candidatus Woesearchaeota archaeon]|nr:hypothetical protein [Candidatus Woesearchaeota archaeon]
SVPRYFVKGNHENWETLNAIKTKQSEAPKNWIYINPGDLIMIQKGQVEIPVMGLGGNFGRNTLKKRYTRKEADDKGKIGHFVHEELDVLFARQYLEFSEKGILLLHEPPQRLFPGGKIGSKVLNYLVDHLKPRITISGHMHRFETKEEPGIIYYGLSKPEENYLTITISEHLTVAVVETNARHNI